MVAGAAGWELPTVSAGRKEEVGQREGWAWRLPAGRRGRSGPAVVGNGGGGRELNEDEGGHGGEEER